MKLVVQKILVIVQIAILIVSLTSSVFVSAADQKKVVFWSSGGAQVEKALRKIIANFESENPDIKIELQMFSDWWDLHRKTLLAVAGGTPPDASRFKPLNIGDLAAKGVVIPLDDFVKRDKISLKDFIDVLIEKSSKYQGKLYVLPQGASAPVMYLNVDMFKEAGLNPERPPQTWDEVIRVGKKLTDPSKRQYGYWCDISTNGFLMALWQNGGEYLSKDLHEPLFNSEKGVEALEWLLSTIYIHKISPPPQELTSDLPILQGKIGMWNRANSGLSYYPTNAPKLNWKTFIFPKKVRRTSMEMCEGCVIFSASKVKEEAWKFVKYLIMNEDSALTFFQEYGHMPVIKKYFNKPPFTTDPKLIPYRWQILNDIEARPLMPSSDLIFDTLTKEINEAVYKNKTPRGALDDAAKQVKEIIAKIQW